MPTMTLAGTDAGSPLQSPLAKFLARSHADVLADDVEPSGEAFNSIRLRADNRPFNPMVNAGAITCSGLICQAEGSGAFACILDTLDRFAGRKLEVDESVFLSERRRADREAAAPRPTCAAPAAPGCFTASPRTSGGRTSDPVREPHG